MCGVPACDSSRAGAEVCGVCDTPELGVTAPQACACARVYARVLVPPNIYTHTYACSVCGVHAYAG